MKRLNTFGASDPGLTNFGKRPTSTHVSCSVHRLNLVIALALMKEGFTAVNLSGIGSQVALLEEFWKRRVELVSHSLERKRLLSLVLNKMIQSKTLSIAEVEISDIELSLALRELLSVELLRRNATGRIFFSHNILFDYALARLRLDEVRTFHISCRRQ